LPFIERSGATPIEPSFAERFRSPKLAASRGAYVMRLSIVAEARHPRQVRGLTVLDKSIRTSSLARLST
jgi:hypothetical protein